MTNFIQAFIEGMGHIFCLDAIDHMVFLLVLTACYDHSSLKKIFWLISAFTIGHAITFVISSFGMTGGVRGYAELLIPITIGLTSVINFLKKEKQRGRKKEGFFTYLFVICFGAVHGLAIGSMLQMKLVKGENFLTQLVGFNLGVELAQIGIVVIILVIQLLLMSLFRIRLNEWRIGISGIGLGAALMILMNNF